MKLYISSHDLTGQRFNGHMLQKEYNQRGEAAVNVVWTKEGGDLNTHVMTPFFGRNLLNKIFDKIEENLSIRNLIQFPTFLFMKDSLFKKASLVHYHVFHWPNYFSILALPFLSRKKPSVWTIHDFWPFTGHCVYPFDCEKWMTGCHGCPYLNTSFPLKKDHAWLLWKIKKFLYKFCRFELVVASKFMLERVQKSPLLKSFPIHLVPFGLDLKKFCPKDKGLAKQLLGIDPNSFVISFRSAPGLFKGQNDIKSALINLPEELNGKITLLTFNVAYEFGAFSKRFHVVDLGWISDDETTLLAYQASDVFLMPSRQESFGMMAMEAMACGVPTIVYTGTSLEEVIGYGSGGIMVPQGNFYEIAKEIYKLFSDKEYWTSIANKGLQFARKNYDVEIHLARLSDVYKAATKNFYEKR